MLKTINLFYTVDDAFLPLVGVSISSIIEYNKEVMNFHVYIATEKDNTTDNYQKLVHFHKNDPIEFIYLNCKMLDFVFEKYNMNKWGSNSFFTYWKFAGFDLIPEEDVWFIDADIICQGRIVKPSLNNKVCGAVLDSAHALYNKLLKISENGLFFNSGIIYVDLVKWKQQQCTKKCIEYIETTKSEFFMADQDLFSLAMYDNVEVLNPEYNYYAGYDYYGINKSFKMYSLDKKTFYSRDQLNYAKNNVIFYHCLKGVFGRPWEENNSSPIKEEYCRIQGKSAFKKYRAKSSSSTIFNVEKKLELLPDFIYCFIHNIATKIYLLISFKK